MSSITIERGALVFRTPYDPDLVADLKARVPATDRRWDRGRKVWIVEAAHGKTLTNLCSRYLGELVLLPGTNSSQAKPETRILEVMYIGQTKDRGDGKPTAFGYCNREWSVILPEDALRDYFSAGLVEEQANKPLTLYATLGVASSVSADELKQAFRRLARQWHPDVCHEPEAEEMFKQLNHAYSILSDDRLRVRYDAGLKLEESLKRQDHRRHYQDLSNAYRSPLRCGYILAEGIEALGRFKVTKILQWNDITDSRGRTLVTSWDPLRERISEAWV